MEGYVMEAILSIFVIAIVTVIIWSVVSSSSNNSSHKRNNNFPSSNKNRPTKSTSNLPELKLTITKEFYAEEVDYSKIAPRSILVPNGIKGTEHPNDCIDFLNYKVYSYSAKFIETNRMRKRTITIWDDNDDIRQKIYSLGYTDPISYELANPRKITERQKDYVKSLVNQTGCTLPVAIDRLAFGDTSGIIYYLTEGGHTPNINMIKYLNTLHIEASYLYPDWLVFEIIWNSISPNNKIAFFAYCVWRDINNPLNDTLQLNDSMYNVFNAFSDKYIEDDKFTRSLTNNYNDGHKLVHFGTTITSEFPISGGSKQTYAYQTTKAYLSNIES